jgi:hypothetical protein
MPRSSLRKEKRSIRKGKRSIQKRSLRKGNMKKRIMYGGYQTNNFHHWITGTLRSSDLEENIDTLNTYLGVIYGNWHDNINKGNKNIYNLKTAHELYDSFYKYFLKSNSDFNKFMQGYKILLKPTFEEYYNKKNPSTTAGLYGGGGFVTLYSWLEKNEKRNENEKTPIQFVCKEYFTHIYNNWNNDSKTKQKRVKIFTSVDEAYDSFYKYFVKSNSNFMKSFKILLKPIYEIMYFNYIRFENSESININPGKDKNEFIKEKITNEINKLLLFKDYIKPVNVQSKKTLYPANKLEVVNENKAFPYGANIYGFPLGNTGEKKEDEEDEEDEEKEGFYGFEESPTESPTGTLESEGADERFGPGEEGGGKRRSKRRITKNSITKNNKTKNTNKTKKYNKRK